LIIDFLFLIRCSSSLIFYLFFWGYFAEGERRYLPKGQNKRNIHFGNYPLGLWIYRSGRAALLTAAFAGSQAKGGKGCPPEEGFFARKDCRTKGAKAKKFTLKF
jgi:hypothetical protein